MDLVNINTETVNKFPKGLKFLVDGERKVKAMKGSKDQRQKKHHACGGILGAHLEKILLLPVLFHGCSVVAVTLIMC